METCRIACSAQASWPRLAEGRGPGVIVLGGSIGSGANSFWALRHLSGMGCRSQHHFIELGAGQELRHG